MNDDGDDDDGDVDDGDDDVDVDDGDDDDADDADVDDGDDDYDDSGADEVVLEPPARPAAARVRHVPTELLEVRHRAHEYLREVGIQDR